eukprot:10928656-Alexandrium_andersonii.AAC.1
MWPSSWATIHPQQRSTTGWAAARWPLPAVVSSCYAFLESVPGLSLKPAMQCNAMCVWLCTRAWG